jgi:hypothetical protein
MVEIGEIICTAVNDDGVCINLANIELRWRFSADGILESKGEESDASHEDRNDGQEAHLFSPCSLLRRSSDA